jgi:hypothetical protein
MVNPIAPMPAPVYEHEQTTVILSVTTKTIVGATVASAVATSVGTSVAATVGTATATGATDAAVTSSTSSVVQLMTAVQGVAVMGSASIIRTSAPAYSEVTVGFGVFNFYLPSPVFASENEQQEGGDEVAPSRSLQTGGDQQSNSSYVQDYNSTAACLAFTTSNILIQQFAGNFFYGSGILLIVAALRLLQKAPPIFHKAALRDVLTEVLGPFPGVELVIIAVIFQVCLGKYRD